MANFLAVAVPIALAVAVSAALPVVVFIALGQYCYWQTQTRCKNHNLLGASLKKHFDLSPTDAINVELTVFDMQVNSRLLTV